MDIIRFFMPSEGKMAVMLLFILGSFIPSSISNFPNLSFDVISQLQLILMLPWLLLDLYSLSFIGMGIWLVYVYVIVMIYVEGFKTIEAMVREEFPHINDRWTKKTKSKISKPTKRIKTRRK